MYAIRSYYGNAATGNTEGVVPADTTEIARPGEHQKLVLGVCVLQREGQLETGIAQVMGHALLDLIIGEREIILAERQVVNTLCIDDVQLHRVPVEESRGNQHDLKTGIAGVPQTPVGLEANALVLLVAQFLHKPGDRFRFLIRLLSQLPCLVDDVLT